MAGLLRFYFACQESFRMKRVILLLLVIAASGTFVFLKLTSNGLLTVSPAGGVYSTFSGGVQTVYEKPPLLAPAADAERWDYTGDVYAELGALDAGVLRTETVCGMTVIYAYTSRLPKSIELGCGKVNLMAAVSGVKISLGYPYLDGSY